MKKPRYDYPPGYGEVEPLANYTPWTTDEGFQSVYSRIREHTMVDEPRLYELWALCRQMYKLPGDVLEVGVWRGGSAAVIASAVGTEKMVYLADTFAGVAKAGPRDDYYKGGEHANTSESIVHELLKSLKIDRYRVLAGVFPDDTAAAIHDAHLCFCHVDVDVYQSALDVVEWVWPRLSVGGVIVFDDYGFYGCEGVTAYVQEMRGRSDAIITTNLNGQALMHKLGGSEPGWR